MVSEENEVVKKIKSKTDDKDEIKINELFHKLGFKYVDNAIKIKVNKRDLGEIDGLFQLDEDYLLILEIENANIDSKKISDFYNKWAYQPNKEILLKKYKIPKKINFINIYINLKKVRTGEKINEASLRQCLSDKSNHFFYKDDIEELTEQEKLIGKWAGNDLICSLDLYKEQVGKKYEEKEGIEITSQEKVAYISSMEVYTLLKNGYVYRRSESNSEGYQRFLKANRINKIQKTIEKKGIIFPSIILSSKKKLKKIEELGSKTFKLNFPDWRGSIRIIDGQHRLLGYSKLEEVKQKESEIPIIIFDNLTKEEEIEMFLMINTEQKKINPNLTLLVKGDSLNWEINTKTFQESIGVSVIKRLNKEKTIFNNKIFLGYNHPQKGKIALATFISALIKNNLIGGSQHLIQNNIKDLNSPFRQLKNIFNALKEKVKSYSDINKIENKKGFFVSNKGIRVFLRLIQFLIKNNKKKFSNISYKDFFKDLNSVMGDKTFKELEKYYGEGGANKAADMLMKKIKRHDKTRRYKKFKINLRNL